MKEGSEEDKEWVTKALELVQILKSYSFSNPFLQPVDITEFPEYPEVVKSPMDLSLVEGSLEMESYNNLSEFEEDMDLIISNSKKFTPNPETEMYKTTIKFERMYQCHLCQLFNKKLPVKYANPPSQPSQSSSKGKGIKVKVAHEGDDSSSSSTEFSDSEDLRESLLESDEERIGMRLLYSSPEERSEDEEEEEEDDEEDHYSSEDKKKKSPPPPPKKKKKLTKKKAATKPPGIALEEKSGPLTLKRNSTENRGIKRKSNIKSGQSTPQPGKRVRFNSTPEVKEIECHKVHLEMEKIRIKNKMKSSSPYQDDDELEKMCKPSQWFAETQVRTKRYFPQRGDDVVYFRQGHQDYLKEVEKRGAYIVTKKMRKSLPFEEDPNLDPQVSLRVNNISYELLPPRMVNLTLALTDWNSKEWKGKHIQVQYHAMENVRDFLVLRQFYDAYLKNNWVPGEKCRCWVSRTEEWKNGIILEKSPLDPKFPKSYFLSYKVLLKGPRAKEERFSPWELCKVNSNDEDEYQKYIPDASDWNGLGQQEECERISNGIKQVIELPISFHFREPVDITLYPNYGYMIEYLMDLGTIKKRLDNLFYRRKSVIISDVNYISTNAIKFNKPDSKIVKDAKMIVDICMTLINCPTEKDVNVIFKRIETAYDSSSPTKPVIEVQKTWVKPFADFLDRLVHLQEAKPFQNLIKSKEFPDFHPRNGPKGSPGLDLSILRSSLKEGKYKNEFEFTQDMKSFLARLLEYFKDKDPKLYEAAQNLDVNYREKFHKIKNTSFSFPPTTTPSTSTSSIVVPSVPTSTASAPKSLLSKLQEPSPSSSNGDQNSTSGYDSGNSTPNSGGDKTEFNSGGGLNTPFSVDSPSVDSPTGSNASNSSNNNIPSVHDIQLTDILSCYPGLAQD